MASKPNNILAISSLRGGLNDADPPLALAEDACTVAENVEFFESTLGERRLGCVAITLPTSITADPAIEAAVWMGNHVPTNTLGSNELWVLAQGLADTTRYVLTHRNQTVWTTVNPEDAIDVTTGYGHKLSAVSLHGKFFIAYKSAVDRLHVWDGTSLRRVGITSPSAAPTAADTGVGTLSGIRYYRVRYVVMSGTTVLRRSEPSSVLTFTPATTGLSVRVTKPAAISAGETHWELEASIDNANFYRIARTLVGTTTYDDSTPYNTGYRDVGPLSEDATSYTLVPSGKYLSVDADRLMIAGSWETPAYQSRIWWTPVLGNTGVGNDERLDMTVNPFIDLDGYEGGEITGLSRSVNGYLYAFKWSHIYKVIRTGNREDAYNAVPLTKSRGALPGSLVEAVDQSGAPCQYFLDPTIGPMRIGIAGIEWCGADIRTFWDRVNITATTPCHGVFYRAKSQVHFWVAVDGATYPNAKIVVHCDELTSTPTGARRGWVTVPVGDRIADAHASIIFSDNVDSAAVRNMSGVPFIGKQKWIVDGVSITDIVQRCDTGATDCFTTGDEDAYYWAQVQSKPFFPAGLLNNFGIMAGSLAAEAVDGALNEIQVLGTKDFGADELKKSVNLIPEGNETIVIKKLDNFSFSELTAIQLTFGDLTDNISLTSWRLHSFQAKLRTEQTS